VIRAILNRLLVLPAMFFGVAIFLFVLTHLIPSDPARVAVGPNASQEAVETMRERMGLNDPLPAQFGQYLWGTLRLDLGNSIYDRRPVLESLKLYVPATVELALVAALIMVGFGLLLGLYGAVHSGSGWERVLRLFAVSGRAVPPFWLALLLQIAFFARLGWLPSGGRLDLNLTPPTQLTGLYLVDSVLTWNWVTFVDAGTHLLLPALALAIGGIADLMRMTRSQVLLELRADYTRTARAKGLTDRIVLFRHVIANAITPVLTVIGIRFGYLLAGTVLIESIFLWPGVGRYALTAIQNFDFPALTGVTLFVTLMFVLVNLLVDLMQVALDPRLRQE
jgi:peptide/nickel transport system permease protein